MMHGVVLCSSIKIMPETLRRVRSSAHRSIIEGALSDLGTESTTRVQNACREPVELSGSEQGKPC